MVMAGGTATVISGFGIYGRWCISQFAGESNLEKSKSGWLQRFNGKLSLALRDSAHIDIGLSPATIPVILILSRTTRLNSIFPFFPLLFLSDTLQLPTLTLECPPSLSLTVAMLPWLRLLYLRTKQEFYSRIGVEQPKWSQVFELDRLPVDEGPMAEDEPILRAEEILSLGRVASTLTTTLLFPLGARLVGNVLYALASRLKGSQITFLKPIHLRTCVGGTLLLFTRDAVELYRGLLRRRKMNSRKIISKGNRLNSIRD